MKVFKYCILIIISVVMIGMFLLFTMRYINLGANLLKTQNEIENAFVENKSIFENVATFLSSLDYEGIYIYDSLESDKMSVSGVHIDIDDSAVIRDIDYLKEIGCEVILKEKKSIKFQMSSNLDKGCGCIYLIDKNNFPLEFVVKLVKLHNNNWYYYEENSSTSGNKEQNQDRGTVLLS